MEIILQRYGGMIPLKQQATTLVNWSDQEVNELIRRIRTEEQKDPVTMNAFCHYLQVNGQQIPVDIQNIPAEYKDVFEHLKSELKYVKS